MSNWTTLSFTILPILYKLNVWNTHQFFVLLSDLRCTPNQLPPPPPKLSFCPQWVCVSLYKPMYAYSKFYCEGKSLVPSLEPWTVTLMEFDSKLPKDMSFRYSSNSNCAKSLKFSCSIHQSLFLYRKSYFYLWSSDSASISVATILHAEANVLK